MLSARMKRTVFPAQAGVIPAISAIRSCIWRIPRASGGDPTELFHLTPAKTYSPRKRG